MDEKREGKGEEGMMSKGGKRRWSKEEEGSREGKEGR